jgi:Sigma-54 interaction domain
MALFEPEERAFAKKAADLVTTNPFHSSWIEKERDMLGGASPDAREVFSWQPGLGLWGPRTVYPDLVDLGTKIVELVRGLRRRLQDGASATPRELDRYETLAIYDLYRNHGQELDRYIDAAVRGGDAPDLKRIWLDFRHDHDALLGIEGRRFPLGHPPAHLFACFFVLRRAFYHIYFNIIGRSRPAAELRSAVWQSIVTHDLPVWSQSLYGRMRDFPTLITGPSGTGKELVAQAIGLSQYIPFDPAAFVTDFVKAFQPVNLSALPPLLIEAELFGHVRGAFGGAVRDRMGRLEECPEHGAVFLDEIGELTAEIQVKLLRVLQTRRFQRVGENVDRTFTGKIIAATNRDLAVEMQARGFREDFYFRLCADRIATPSLSEQLADNGDDLPVMAEFICRRVVGEEKAAALAGEVADWIRKHPRLGPGYPWPGNFRELEQCVRSYTIRKDYQPLHPAPPARDTVNKACETLAEAVVRQLLPYDEIERRLFCSVYDRTGSTRKAARVLGRDWRTVQARVTATDRRSADG